jgi:predicted Rossmann-fold nucleotide-binding protein
MLRKLSGKRVLVCGGRNYQDWRAVADTLGRLHESSSIGLIIHGCDPGAAALAVRWALMAGVPTSGFDADFQSHGPAAERVRNARMIVEGKPDLVIAFSGGKGTTDLVSRATVAGLPVDQVCPDALSVDGRRCSKELAPAGNTVASPSRGGIQLP